MRKFLIGPALTGIGWVAGSYYGAAAEQLVHKTPDATYDGISQVLDNMPQKGTTYFDGGKPVPYEIQVDRLPDERLTVHLLFDGHEGGRTDILFTPQNAGQDTLVTATAHGERAVLGETLAGTSEARLAYAPDWMLNLLTLRPLLKQIAGQIEQGQPAAIPGMSQADWEAKLSPDEQHQMQEWQQYDAARPTTDPNADAQRFMDGNQAN